MSIRVLLCCEQAIICAGLRSLLTQRGLQVVEEPSKHQVVAAAKREMVDAVLLVAPAHTAADRQRLTELARLSRVVLVDQSEDAARSLEALRAGARAVLSVDSSHEELVLALRVVVESDAIVIPAAVRGSLKEVVECGSAAGLAVQTAESLTVREREVILLLAQGRSNADIAEKLSISRATVRSHVHHLLRKLDVGTRAQAVAVAYETGLIVAVEEKLAATAGAGRMVSPGDRGGDASG